MTITNLFCFLYQLAKRFLSYFTICIPLWRSVKVCLKSWRTILKLSLVCVLQTWKPCYLYIATSQEIIWVILIRIETNHHFLIYYINQTVKVLRLSIYLSIKKLTLFLFSILQALTLHACSCNHFVDWPTTTTHPHQAQYNYMPHYVVNEFRELDIIYIPHINGE